MRCYQERVTATSVHIFVPSMNPGAYALAVIPKRRTHGSYLSETLGRRTCWRNRRNRGVRLVVNDRIDTIDSA